MEVSIRPPRLAYFVEHDIGYQPSKFQCSRMSGANFMEGVEKTPPPLMLQRDKSPVLIGLRLPHN